jgi:excisionase family DNA binding protein
LLIKELAMKLLTTKEAAERLGVGYVRVNQLIKEGRLPAEKMGRDYMIKESDLKLVQGRKPGRPPKKVSKKEGKKKKL